MSPRFELLMALPHSNEAPRITTLFRKPLFSVEIAFDQPVNQNITFDGWVCQAFALNPGCSPELDVKLTPGIYCIHNSPWVRGFKFGLSPISEKAPDTRHFLFLFGNGTRIDLATSKATITDSSGKIEVPFIKPQPFPKDFVPKRFASRAEQCIVLPSISYEPADDLDVEFKLNNASSLTVLSLNEFSAERQNVTFSGVRSFIYYVDFIPTERPCPPGFSEMIQCNPSREAGIFADHRHEFRSFYIGLPKAPLVEVACEEYVRE